MKERPYSISTQTMIVAHENVKLQGSWRGRGEDGNLKDRFFFQMAPAEEIHGGLFSFLYNNIISPQAKK
jgi:hypothetical protein